MQIPNFNFTNFNSMIASEYLNKFIQGLQGVNSRIEDEFLLTASEQQLNEALKSYVTKNVKMILEMKIELHDGWFRMTCIVFMSGIYMHLASNFELVHIQMDRYRQRLVFAQISETEVLELHAKSYLKKLAIKKALPLYSKLLKDDPLRELFRRMRFSSVKDNIIYLDIGVWLRANRSIMSNLHKFQINYGIVAPEQLVLKAKINPKDMLPSNRVEDIITEKDNPNL